MGTLGRVGEGEAREGRRGSGEGRRGSGEGGRGVAGRGGGQARAGLRLILPTVVIAAPTNHLGEQDSRYSDIEV